MTDDCMVHGLLRYPGGKQKLVKEIGKYIPQSFREYREPFMGGGSMFFYVKNTTKSAHNFWGNDLYAPVANFWIQVLNESTHFLVVEQVEKLIKEYKGKLLFEFIKTNYDNSTPLDQAAMLFCLNRITFSGLTFSGGYSSQAHEGRLKQSHIDLLRNCNKKYSINTAITNKDYNVLLETPPTIKGHHSVFIYMDPPYDIKSDNLYGTNGNQHKGFDHLQFVENCKQCKHRWLITYNDSERIRELFQDCAKRIIEIPVAYNMNSMNKKKTELLIMNY